MQLEKCSNCGRDIGRLETPHVFQQYTVCPECHNRLSNPVSAPAVATSASHHTALKFGKPPRPMKVMLWVGIILWFGPALLAIASGSAEAQQGFVQLEWLGAILAIGPVVVWAIIVAAKSAG